MQVNVEKTSSVQCKLSVTIPAVDVDKAYENAFREVSKGARIPGFRKGKVPRAVIEKQFASELHSEVESHLINDTLFRAMMDHNVAPVATPQVAPGKLEKGVDFSYTANVETRPDIELKSYKGLKTTKVEVKIDDKDIDAELEKMRAQAVQLVPVLDRDVVQDKDVVVTDFTATVNGEPLPGGAAQGALVEIGGTDYIPGFAEGLLGAKVPGDRELNVTFPADYSVAHLAGKPAVFKVQLKELKKKELPALDDAFAEDLGEESLESMKTKIRDGLTNQKKEQAEGERKRALLKELVEGNGFDVPPSMIAEQADRMIINAAAYVQAMTGQKIKPGELDFDKLRQDNRPDAEFQVRSGLLLAKVAEVEKIEVDDKDVDAEIDRMATEAGEQGPRLRAQYQENEAKTRLRYRLLEDRVMKFLFDHAVEA